MGNEGDAFKKLYGIVMRLRSSGGCPWDLEQTPASLRGDLIEETYECIEAIDEQNPAHVKEELGDVFLLVTMLAYMYQQEGAFSVSDSLECISEKLIRRHPHVFGSNAGGSNTDEPSPSVSTAEVMENWAKIKAEKEGRSPKDSILDEVRRGLPPLDRAWKLQKKASKTGFDWPDAAGVIDKIKEELREVEAAISNAHNNAPETSALEEELGDLLFSAVNLCRYFNIEPSVALQRTNVKFTERFRHVEKRMRESGEEMTARNLALMDQFWNEAKTT